MANTAQTEQFFDAVLGQYDTALKAIEKAQQRGLKLSQDLLTATAKRQRETIELARKVAAEPTNYAGAYSAIMEASVAAQSQALELSQTAYQEALDASAEVREVLEALVDASRGLAEAGFGLMNQWSGGSPLADLLQQGLSAFTGATQAGTPRAGGAS